MFPRRRRLFTLDWALRITMIILILRSRDLTQCPHLESIRVFRQKNTHFHLTFPRSFSNVLEHRIDPCIRSIPSDDTMYTRSRGVQLSLSTRSLARLHQEEAKKRKRARATRRRIPRFAPAGRKGVERSRNVREEKEGAKEEGEEEAEQEKKEMREREVRENRRSGENRARGDTANV